MEEKPIVEIYKECGRRRYRVVINGKEIENLRSFSIQVSNELKDGIHEAPFYQVEQYLPACTLKPKT